MSTRVGILIAETFIDAAIVRYRGRGWRIVRHHQGGAAVPTTLQAETQLDTVADLIQEAIRTINGIALPAHLIVPSSWCFHQPVQGNQRRFDQKAAAFQFEEYLPLPLEEVTCAFARGRSGRHTGLAIRTAPIRRLLERLGQARIHVEHLYVDSFVTGAWAASCDGQTSGTVLLGQHRLAVSLTTPNGGRPHVVRSILCRDAADVEPAVGLTETVAGAGAGRWLLFDLRTDGAADAVPPHLFDQAEHLHQAEAVTRLQLAATEHGRAGPDLCRGDLAPVGRWSRTCRLAAWCAVLLTLLLLMGAGDFHRRRSACREANGGLGVRQVQLFKEALPGCPVPVHPALRLASERIRLEGVTRTARSSASSAGPFQDRDAAIDALRHFVAALPQDVRIRLLDWSIDRSQLSVRGQTTGHRDAERITEAVNAIPGLTARPPRTARLAGGGVTFTIRATREHHESKPKPTLVDAR